MKCRNLSLCTIETKMAKCHHRNDDVGSLPLDHSSYSVPHYHHHRHRHRFRQWLRRKLIAAISCGGGAAASSALPKSPKKKPKPKPNPSHVIRTRSESDKLYDLLNLSDSFSSINEKKEEEEDLEEVKRKEERLEELRAAVRFLQSEEIEERENGAKLVRKLAKEDCEARSTMAMLGAIPPLVGMIIDDNGGGCDQIRADSQIEALYALLNLGIGNDLNKAAIVQAGAVHKMLKKIDSSNGSLESSFSEALVVNFLALSALDSNKPIIGASGAIPFLVRVLENSDDKQWSSQATQDSLRALYNLSLSSSNIPLIVETNLIHLLINTLDNMEVSERILSILSSVISTSEGRRSISAIPDALHILIDVLNWTDSPGCQEKASYILMVMAHKSYSDRQTMIEAGIRSALLELTLLGSTLAQKRASRILECLSLDKGKQVSQGYNGNSSSAAVSAPIYGSSSSTANVNNEEEDIMMSEEKKAVKQLVQQSLHNNMKKIVKRANLPRDFVPSEHLKSLTVCSTSKSLPF